MRILISGTSGLIGGALLPRLRMQGHQVQILTRTPHANDEDSIAWDPNLGLGRPHLVEGLDAFLHLAGENIARKRWTPSQKDRLRSSRIHATERLVDQFLALDAPPRAFLCASAVGFYGSRGETLLDESSQPGQGFLANLTKEWEAAAARAQQNHRTRVVHLRFGMVLGRNGGALAKMLPIFKLGMGGPLGSGTAYLSWISLEDTCRAILHLLEHDTVAGPVNLVSPNPVRNRQFAQALGKAVGRPAFVPAPAFMLKLLLGAMAEELLLASARVVPERLLGSGFQFQFPTLDAALHHELHAAGKSAAD